jgi:hypothetical protein
MLEREAYLLQNQLNPFPIGGKLVLSDDGRLSFSSAHSPRTPRWGGWRRRSERTG